MHSDLTCLSSDAVNRYDITVTISAFETSLKDTFEKGIPMLVGHDFHRPIGWHLPFGIFIEAGLSRFLTHGVSASEPKELQLFEQKVIGYLKGKYDEDFARYEYSFLPLIREHLSAGYAKISNGCVAVTDAEIAVRKFPALFEDLDKDGLTTLSDLQKHFTYLGQGVFKHKSSDLTIFAHSHFRRSQSRLNNFHFFFLDDFMTLKDNADVTLRIRMDPDMIGFAPSFHISGEFQYHYGPKYTDELEKIPQQITRHVCTEEEEYFSDVAATEFFWKNEPHEKTLEIEELRAFTSPVSGQYHCRYIHSIYDSQQQTFVHFDGAMRSYDRDAMETRKACTFVQFGKKAAYEKLFRIDGKLGLDRWKTLITKYYQDNPLIYEYFGIRDEWNALQLQPATLSKQEELLPFDIHLSEGLKILVSYHRLPESLRQEERYLDIPDRMSNEKEVIYCIEYLVYEVKKVLQTMGGDLIIPEDWSLISFNDRYWNIPSIMHAGQNVNLTLNLTVQALQAIFTDIVHKGIDKDISLTLGFTFNDRIIRISSYGHVTHQLRWLGDQFPIPFSEDGLTGWVKEQRSYLNRFSPRISNHFMQHLVQTDGVLFIRRVPLKIDWQLADTEEGLAYHLDFGAGDEHLETLQIFNEGKIRPVVCLIIHKAVWMKTGEDYFSSEKSRLTTDDVVSVTETEPLALYWTKGSV